MLLAVGAVLCGVVTAALLSETFLTRTRYTASAITVQHGVYDFRRYRPVGGYVADQHHRQQLSPTFYLIAIRLLATGGWCFAGDVADFLRG